MTIDLLVAMKCSKCGFRARSLPAMAKHYRKKHPSSMKRKTHIVRKLKQSGSSGMSYCPHCGGKL